MRSFAIISAVFAAAVSAESSSTPAYSNPNTQYLTETNSVGIITGGPAVVTSQPAGAVAVTSQPAVVTSQPLAASFPAGLSTGLNTVPYGNSTVTVSMSGSITSIIRATPTAGSGSGSGASGSGAAASGTSSGAKTSSSAGAAAHIKAGGAALGFAGAMFAAFL